VTSLLVLVAASSLGIDYGWQPVAGGGIEYIIRLEPETLDDLVAGTEDIVSDLPANMVAVRSLRLTTIEGPLPNEGEDPPRPLRFAGPATNARDRVDRGPPYERDASSQNDTLAWLLSPVPGDPPSPVSNDLKLISPNGRRPATTRYSWDDKDKKDEEPSATDVQEKPTAKGGGRANNSEPSSPSDSPREPANAENRPWIPFTIALLTLALSVLLNGYQGWIHAELRRRYQSALEGLIS
jgi:hypothetical protein